MKKASIFRSIAATSGLALSLAAVQGQTIIQGEYFFDTDPGFGMANAFVISTPNDTISESLSISSTGLTPGRHQLFTRLQEDDGTWGITNKREVYIVREIVSAEYFWDVDPGQGNGTALTTYDDGGQPAICDRIATTGLVPGAHSVYVRFMSADGAWSFPSRSDVIITENNTPIGCPGDFDNNGSINTSDLLVFLGGFGEAFNCELDLTEDFAVNTSDLLLFLGVFGGVCP